VLIKASRDRSCSVQAFKLDTAHLKSTAASFPGAFLGNGSFAILSPNIKYHTSFWLQDAIGHGGAHNKLVGQDAYLHALSEVTTAYPSSDVKVHSAIFAADDRSRDTFVWFNSTAINRGPYAGQQPTQAQSHVHGIYRMRFDASGKVSDAWCYRNATAEEMSLLIRPEAAAPCSWSPSLRLQPCSWEAGDKYSCQIMAAAEAWAQEVWSKASLQALLKLSSPDIEYYDGTCLHRGSGPLVGSRALIDLLLKESLEYELGPVVQLALVPEGGGNKVFLHWSQSLICRRTGDLSAVDGACLLVFNQAGQVVQMLDYHNPVKGERAGLFKETHLVRIKPQAEGAAAAAAAPGVPGGSSGSQGMSSEVDEILARQEREWMNF